MPQAYVFAKDPARNVRLFAACILKHIEVPVKNRSDGNCCHVLSVLRLGCDNCNRRLFGQMN